MRAFTRLAFSAAIRVARRRYGSRERNETLEQRDPDYPAPVERVIRIRIEAWDTNCNSHISHLVPANG